MRLVSPSRGRTSSVPALALLAAAGITTVAACEKRPPAAQATLPPVPAVERGTTTLPPGESPGSGIHRLPRFAEAAAFDPSAYDQETQTLILGQFASAMEVMKLDPDLIAALGDERGIVVPYSDSEDLAEKLALVLTPEEVQSKLFILKSHKIDAVTLSAGQEGGSLFHAVFIKEEVLQSFPRYIAVLNHELWHVALNSKAPGTAATDREREIETYRKSIESLTRIHAALQDGAAVVSQRLTTKLIEQLDEQIEEERRLKESWERGK